MERLLHSCSLILVMQIISVRLLVQFFQSHFSFSLVLVIAFTTTTSPLSHGLGAKISFFGPTLRFDRKCLQRNMISTIGKKLVNLQDSPIMPLPLPSNRQHLSCGDCLEGKRGDYLTSSVLLCIIIMCTSYAHLYNEQLSSSYTVDWIGL